MRELVVIGLVSWRLMVGPAVAHDPALHDFEMKIFEPAVKVPVREVKDLNGSQTVIGGPSGQSYLLLNFWATWCPPCVKEMPSLQRLHEKIVGKGLKIVAVSIDKAADHTKVRRFTKKFALTIPVVHDPSKELARAYRAIRFPTTLLINPRGEVVALARGERNWSSPQALSYFREIAAQAQ